MDKRLAEGHSKLDAIRALKRYIAREVFTPSRDAKRKSIRSALQLDKQKGVRGGQYSSDDFRNELAKHSITCSMSSTGSCYDNAAVESFFGFLKRERVNRVRYRSREEARADLFEYIGVFYNRKRLHGYLGNISPVDFEEKSHGSF